MELLPLSPVLALARSVDMATSTRPTSETPVIKSATEARDGVTGQGVRYVLIWSVLAVVVIFGGLWFFYFH
jgi:hypothetical protein